MTRGEPEVGPVEQHANAGGRLRRGLLALLSVLVIAVSFTLATGSTTLPPGLPDAPDGRGDGGAVTLDADLCPQKRAAIGHRAAFLVDLRKRLAPNGRSRPGELLEGLAAGLGKGDELTVFALSEYALAPRIPLGRLCKPFAPQAVARGTKALAAPSAAECGKLPVQLPRALRDVAGGFCERRARLRDRVDDLANRQTAGTGNAYLVEALEETVAGFADAKQRTLYVFSDMFQQGDWYSHSQVEWRRWEFAHFLAQRENSLLAPLPAKAAALAVTPVEIFYLPRRGSTERSEVRARHQAFWTDYFAERALRPTFHDQLL